MLETPSKCFLWIGQASLTDEGTYGKAALEIFTPADDEQKAEIIKEGSEPEEFWNALGGKHDYSKIASDIIDEKKVSSPRLFQYKENSTEEISNFQRNVSLNVIKYWPLF